MLPIIRFMGKHAFTIFPLLLLALACSGPAPVSVLKPEADKLHNGMQPEEVQAICGKPAMNFSDPLSGSAMWIYKDEKVGDRLTVSFNMDGVAKVKYTGA